MQGCQFVLRLTAKPHCIGCVTRRRFCCSICSHEALMKSQICAQRARPCQSHGRTTASVKRQRQIHSMNYEWMFTTGLDSCSPRMCQYGSLWPVTHSTERSCVRDLFSHPTDCVFLLTLLPHCKNINFYSLAHTKIEVVRPEKFELSPHEVETDILAFLVFIFICDQNRKKVLTACVVLWLFHSSTLQDDICYNE